jgi:hypothetical protein
LSELSAPPEQAVDPKSMLPVGGGRLSDLGHQLPMAVVDLSLAEPLPLLSGHHRYLPFVLFGVVSTMRR